MARKYDFIDESFVDEIPNLRNEGSTFPGILRFILTNHPQATVLQLGFYLDAAFGLRASGWNAFGAWQKGRITDEELELLISCKITDTLHRQRSSEYVARMKDILTRVRDKLPHEVVKPLEGLLSHNEWSRAFPFFCEQMQKRNVPIGHQTYRGIDWLGRNMGFKPSVWQDLAGQVSCNEPV